MNEEYIINDITITDEIAEKIIEKAEKACSDCQEFDCWSCEYRHWRGMKENETSRR